MEVIIISDTKQQFNGKNYWKDKSSGYYRNAQVKPHSLHRKVWIYHNGEIPKGLVIDHIDRNKDNNEIENLRLATYSENIRNIDDEVLEKKRAHINNIRELAKEWHKSEEGRKWHSEMAKKIYEKRQPRVLVCAHCGKEFTTTQYSKKTRFCGQNCRMKARRRRLAGLPENAKNY